MDGPNTVPLFPVASTHWKVTSDGRLCEVERDLEAEKTVGSKQPGVMQKEVIECRAL